MSSRELLLLPHDSQTATLLSDSASSDALPALTFLHLPLYTSTLCISATKWYLMDRAPYLPSYLETSIGICTCNTIYCDTRSSLKPYLLMFATLAKLGAPSVTKTTRLGSSAEELGRDR